MRILNLRKYWLIRISILVVTIIALIIILNYKKIKEAESIDIETTIKEVILCEI